MERTRRADSTQSPRPEWVQPATWHPTDDALKNVEITKVADDRVFVSSSETAVFQFCVRHHLGVKACNELLAILRHTAFDPSTIQYANIETWHKQMDFLNKHGIHYANMRDDTIDGAQDVHFYYRPAWDIIVDLLASSRLAQYLQFGYHPQYNAETGEQEYSEFLSADWMKWAADLFSDITLTILAVFVGSDGTQVKNRGSAHPVYLSLGNFMDWYCLTGEAWKTAALVPQLDHSLMQEKGYRNKVFGTRQASKNACMRRERQLFQACAWLVLKSLADVVNEGGQHVATGGGVVRKCVPLVCEWLTDRKECELITGGHTCQCYHCEVPPHLIDTPGDWELIDSSNVQQMIAEANTTGEYGGDAWWVKYALSATRALPILTTETWPDGSIHHNVVQSWERYDHFSTTTGFRADPNPLHQLPHCNLNQICRDDVMHCVLSGIMEHVLAAMMSHIIM